MNGVWWVNDSKDLSYKKKDEVSVNIRSPTVSTGSLQSPRTTCLTPTTSPLSPEWRVGKTSDRVSLLTVTCLYVGPKNWK